MKFWLSLLFVFSFVFSVVGSAQTQGQKKYSFSNALSLVKKIEKGEKPGQLCKKNGYIRAFSGQRCKDPVFYALAHYVCLEIGEDKYDFIGSQCNKNGHKNNMLEKLWALIHYLDEKKKSICKKEILGTDLEIICQKEKQKAILEQKKAEMERSAQQQQAQERKEAEEKRRKEEMDRTKREREEKERLKKEAQAVKAEKEQKFILKKPYVFITLVPRIHKNGEKLLTPPLVAKSLIVSFSSIGEDFYDVYAVTRSGERQKITGYIRGDHLYDYFISEYDWTVDRISGNLSKEAKNKWKRKLDAASSVGLGEYVAADLENIKTIKELYEKLMPTHYKSFENIAIRYFDKINGEDDFIEAVKRKMSVTTK